MGKALGGTATIESSTLWPGLKKIYIKWEVFSYRPFHEKGAAAFEAELRVVDWSEILCKIDTNSAANCIQHMMDDIMCRHFPLKTVKVKETDLPWINGTAHKSYFQGRSKERAMVETEKTGWNITGQEERSLSPEATR